MAFVGIPRLLSELVTEACGEAQVDPIAQFDDLHSLEQALALAPDIVLIGIRGGTADNIAASVLARIPTAKVLALTNGGRDFAAYEIRRTVRENFSLANLLAELV